MTFPRCFLRALALAVSAPLGALSSSLSLASGIGPDIPVMRDSAEGASGTTAMLLALLLLAVLAGMAFYLKRRQGLPGVFTRLAAGAEGAGVRRVNRVQLNGKVALEAVEFDGQTLLLAVTGDGVVKLASTADRASAPASEASEHA